MAATLTGLAIGDALGMPFETLDHDHQRLTSWRGDYQGSNFHQLEPGQWTDDTSMAKMIAESLLDNQGFDPHDLSRRYVNWYDQVGGRGGMGGSTAKAISNLKRGVPWCASSVPSTGNGTAMRVAPLGVYYRHDLTILQKVVRAEAAITHDSKDSQNGAVAVALGVAILARGDYQHDQRTPLSVRIVDAFFTEPSETRGALYNAVPWSTNDALKQMISLGRGFGVNQAIASAFYAFQATRGYSEAIELAVRSGGDTDTKAAITGALAGTYYGTCPNYYLQGLQDVAAIAELDKRLYDEAPRY